MFAGARALGKKRRVAAHRQRHTRKRQREAAKREGRCTFFPCHFIFFFPCGQAGTKRQTASFFLFPFFLACGGGAWRLFRWPVALGIAAIRQHSISCCLFLNKKRKNTNRKDLRSCCCPFLSALPLCATSLCRSLSFQTYRRAIREESQGKRNRKETNGGGGRERKRGQCDVRRRARGPTCGVGPPLRA